MYHTVRTSKLYRVIWASLFSSLSLRSSPIFCQYVGNVCGGAVGIDPQGLERIGLCQENVHTCILYPVHRIIHCMHLSLMLLEGVVLLSAGFCIWLTCIVSVRQWGTLRTTRALLVIRQEEETLLVSDGCWHREIIKKAVWPPTDRKQAVQFHVNNAHLCRWMYSKHREKHTW